ncbi:hypothetical protein KDA_32200 [Dictyobacter alpinus]|uniref:Uncharacterized protein n=1 Tax=Dictyobacter alpinus TaxID=2014873 RepID=A0A402B8S9_9CHLR|nr:hypothetical protein [Dictyobacter alpinus]GCE27736.1 hypothetical protein KDA_32200 [Dictyobacter alpinus]
MNIWDSVHRGLEKASNEAGRIARIQRTRFQIDKLGRQITEQERALVEKVIDLYVTRALVQNELVTPAQELFQARQQLMQAQQELQTLHNQNPTATADTNTYPPQTLPGEGDASQYAPTSPYQQPYTGPTIPVTPPPADNKPAASTGEQLPSLLPPPPPGMSPLTIHSEETIIDTMDVPHVQTGPAEVHSADMQTVREGTPVPPPPPRRCSACGSLADSENMYCHNCGKALQQPMIDHLPTVRARSSSPAIEELPTTTLPDGGEEQSIVRSESPQPSIDTPSSEKD